MNTNMNDGTVPIILGDCFLEVYTAARILTRYSKSVHHFNNFSCEIKGYARCICFNFNIFLSNNSINKNTKPI